MLAVISLLPSYNSRFADGINLATLRTKNHRPRKPCLWCWDKSNNQLPEFNPPCCKFHGRTSGKERKFRAEKAKEQRSLRPPTRCECHVQQLHTKMQRTLPPNSCIRGNYNLRIFGNKYQHRISQAIDQVSREERTGAKIAATTIRFERRCNNPRKKEKKVPISGRLFSPSYRDRLRYRSR